ncbi:hypothetical protein [Thiomonas bhubaneswarensis]|uniref:Uncharacterized protein n=1 Tax=Thiomonas bhubaneswarensis TaxID=339866 RepID=A0A0K6I064_9BURK|nr:hypothetical protein [Thiomonas bhubaneswarensis]CUA96549.1 hypothetical protein Ga0061069_104186 [Thiomonas bhubaneswarensis]
MILKQRPPEPTGALTMHATEYHPELQARMDELAALDARVEANRARQAEIDRALNHSAGAPETAPATALDIVAKLLRPGGTTEAPVPTAAERAKSLRQEWTRLRDEIDLLQRVRADMVSRINLERDRACARRLQEADATEQPEALQAAASALLDVHRKGRALAKHLQSLGYPVVAPHYFSRMELSQTLEGLLERAAKGMETELPEPPPPYRGPPVQKYTERRFIRSESNF